MAFTIPSDDDIRKLFGMLSKEDIEDLKRHYDEDVEKARKRLSKQNDR